MSDTFKPIRPLQPKQHPVDGVCVDCKRPTPAAEVARMLRIDAQGQGRVVCNDCSARIHAAKQPTPIVVQRPQRRSLAAPDEPKL